MNLSSSNIFLSLLLKKDFKSACSIFLKAFDEFSDDLDTNNLVSKYENLLKMLKCFKATFFTCFENEKSNVLRKLLILGAIFDALNSINAK